AGRGRPRPRAIRAAPAPRLPPRRRSRAAARRLRLASPFTAVPNAGAGGTPRRTRRAPARRHHMTIKPLGVYLLAAALVLGAAHGAWAHGLIGQRFFPATLAIDDPFVADE